MPDILSARVLGSVPCEIAPVSVKPANQGHRANEWRATKKRQHLCCGKERFKRVA